MTYVNLSEQTFGQNMFIADVTLTGDEASPVSIPHGISTLPLMFWAQLISTTDTVSTDGGRNPPPPLFLLSVDAVNVRITAVFPVDGFYACTFRLYVARPFSSTL